MINQLLITLVLLSIQSCSHNLLLLQQCSKQLMGSSNLSKEDFLILIILHILIQTKIPFATSLTCDSYEEKWFQFFTTPLLVFPLFMVLLHWCFLVVFNMLLKIYLFNKEDLHQCSSMNNFSSTKHSSTSPSTLFLVGTGISLKTPTTSNPSIISFFIGRVVTQLLQKSRTISSQRGGIDQTKSSEHVWTCIKFVLHPSPFG